MDHCENTLRIEGIGCINNESLDDFGACALAGCTNYIILHNYFKIYFKCILGCSNLMLYIRAQLLEKRPNRKYSTSKQLNGPRGFEIVLNCENVIF